MKFIPKPQPFVLANTQNGMMILNHKDRKDTKNGSFGVGFEFLETGSYAVSEVKTACKILELKAGLYKSDILALDCGANIGAHSIAWAKTLQNIGLGSVLAFEAQERLYYALCGNIALNNCFNIRAKLCALGSPNFKGEQILIPQPNYNQISSFGSFELIKHENNEFIGQEVEYEKGLYVELVSIDNLELKRIDFIKLDVEGMEMSVLLGAKESIEKFKPSLMIEIIKSNKDEIVNFLNSFGYEIYPFGINILAIHKDDKINEHIKICD